MTTLRYLVTGVGSLRQSGRTVRTSQRVTEVMMPHSASRLARLDGAALEDLPNVGPAIAADLRGIGIRAPRDLHGRDPYALYDALNRATGTRHDPCVLDTFIAAVRYVEGAPPHPWWKYTAQRKRTLAALARRKEKTHG